MYMKRDKYETSVIDDNESDRPCINEEALNLKNEELYLEKKYTFRIGDESLSIFKSSEEPYIHSFLKACGYYLYKPLYNTLEIDPPLFRKYRSDLLALDYTNEPLCWIECFERDCEKIEYICKHIHVEEFILIEISNDIKKYIEFLKKKIHYKYHHLITVVNFVPELIYYVDSDDMYISDDWYQIIDLI